jgi:predicted dehydrogenase
LINLGIIGLGAMGAHTLRAATGLPDVAVRIAADLRADLVDQARASYPGVTFTTDPAEVIASPSVHAVYISTPPATHADLAVAAMESGKAVFCEKPLAVSRDDGRRIIAAAERHGSVGAVNFALSDRHATLEMERALRAGEVGDVVAVDIRLSFPEWPRAFQRHATWLAGRAQGGFVREVFSHFAYLTDRLIGPIEVELARVIYSPSPQDASESHAYGVLRAGGVPIHVTASAGVAAPELYEWTLWATKRSYRLREWDQLYAAEGAEWVAVPLDGAKHGSEASRLQLFAAAVRGEPSRHLADFATALRVQEVVEAFHS